ncbi:MAG: hypothetical protein IKU07_07880 [Oscillospiraceae bacterium]|nr:hypothetical protein [Oscillospiraceae bacterium]
MIDLHTHILPQMDDGSQSVEETAKLLEILQQQGVTELAATPHFYASRENPEAFLLRREECIRNMPSQTSLLIHYGAEVAYFPGMQNCDDLTRLKIGDSDLLLVEMPFRTWTDRVIEDICAIPSQLGLTPVLAHVDRYRGLGQFLKYRHHLADNEVLFQCNAEAFERGASCRWALKQIKEGFIDFLGSDCHNLTTRAPKLSTATEIIQKKAGAEVLAQLAETAADYLHGE